MLNHHVILRFPPLIELPDSGQQHIAASCKPERAGKLRRAQLPQVKNGQIPLYTAFIAKFPVIRCRERIEIGKDIAFAVQNGQRFLKTGADTARAAVLRQRCHAADSAHFVATAVKLHPIVCHIDCAHHLSAFLVKRGPDAGIFRKRCQIVRIKRRFKSNGKQLRGLKPLFLCDGAYKHMQ